MTTPTATARISSKKQTLEDAYSPPANFLEIDVSDPQTHGVAKKRYTDYEVRMKVMNYQTALDLILSTCRCSFRLCLKTAKSED